MRFIFLSVFLFLSTWCYSQEIIHGKVVSETGAPLQGASVFISNTTIGTTTNTRGEYYLTKLPPGNVEIVITFVGYETATFIVKASKRNDSYLIKLRREVKELAPITLGFHFEQNGWKKWGDIFKTAFIGTSVYAKDCTIKNQDSIKFIYHDSVLYAYALGPLIIENKALGYVITVTLTRFLYDALTGNVDYKMYSLFREMQGSDDDMMKWRKNRERAYPFSLMHFMRALYSQNLKNEGYQIRFLDNKVNDEKIRVNNIYQHYANQVTGPIDNDLQKEVETNRLIKKDLGRDSLKYYKKILLQQDRITVLHDTLLEFKDIAYRTDSNTVMLKFNNYIQVIYKKMKEPEEYLNYKKTVLYSVLNFYNKGYITREYPVTELTLQEGIPVEITENGYFNNIDLYMNGFWGWWEKLATKLPYQYEP